MPEHSVQLAALAATLINQEVTHHRLARSTESRLAGSLNNLSVRLADLAGARTHWPRSR